MAEIAKKIAVAGINLRAFSGAAISNRAIFYLGFDTNADANKAMQVLEEWS